MISKGQNRFDVAQQRTGAQIPPAPYFANIIEGAVYADRLRGLPKTGSDLSVGTNAGRWTDIPEQFLLPISDRCRNSGGSGATLRAVSLRKPAIEKEARLRPQQYTFRGGITACSYNATGTSRLGGQEAAPVPPLSSL